MLELLSPAGSMEALRAAVQNGANAVYLGVGNLNARQSAKNFTPQTLVDAVKYCHVRGVDVHLTLNTLVSDREMKEAAELIRHAAQYNIDAFIVQDLGVVQLCRQIAPHIPIHGSTQMTVHSLPGVQLCAAMGMKRVVLSRELSREEIRYICANSPIEIEVFAHGALCMSYSGQCYLSAAIGGRSGNRGRCAQPCRQSYGYGRWEEKYPLSLKDNCLVHYLGELESMGVASVKLEGRKLEDLNATQLADVRKNLIGLVFQKFYLVPHLTAVENVMVAQYYHSVVDEKQAMEALEKVGLKDRAHHLPGQLSGGEQQRVCVARALINDPKLILADEPTGNLDEKNEKIVLDLFRKLHEQGTTIIVVTHDALVASCAQREIMLNHGVLVGEKWNDEDARKAYEAAGGKPASTGAQVEGAQNGETAIGFADPTKAAKTGGEE